jgi:chloramphenicol 3-O-phosphotransferase
MRLVFLYGPPAVGKLTVGRALADLTGFRLFHNHLTVNAVGALFPRGSGPFNRLLREFRCRMLAEAAGAGVDVIMTWAYPRNGEEAAVQYAESVESRGGRVHLVQLVCETDVLLGRIGDASRRALDKLTDPVRARELLGEQYTPRPLPFGESLVVDTTALPPAEAAARIASHYGLRP